MRCPGSVREGAKYPDNSGPAAIDGTHTHHLLDHCLKSGFPNAVALVGMELKDHEGIFIVDKERAERVNMALDYVATRKKELNTTVVNAEEKLNGGNWIGRDDMAGTTDIQIVGDTVLEVIDYKDGMGEVDVKDNDQLLNYAAGSLYDYYIANDNVMPFEVVRMTIIQPKIVVKGLESITHCEVSTQDVVDYMTKKVHPAAIATDDPEAPLIAGEIQCKWCPAKGCTARVQQSLERVGIDFGKVDMAQVATDKDINALSNEEIVDLLEAKPLILQMLAGVEEEAMTRLKAGQVIEGIKVVRGRGSREYSVDDETMAKKLKSMGVPKDVIYPTKLISPAQVFNAAWTTRNDERKCLSKRQLETIETNYIKKTKGKLTVALASDSRKAEPLDAVSIFAGVTPTEAPVENKQVVEQPTALPSWLTGE
jgi:hypothetical protein